MTKNELNNEYFEWMYQLVRNKNSKKLSYRKLLYYLHITEFVYIIGMDGNRAEDGIDLRYRFGYEHEHESSMVAVYLDDRSCSILEMMIALAIRCEEHIMDDPDVGNRTGQWFWGMITNLGLGNMNDSKFDAGYADSVVSRFLNREYKRNGEGGLFTVEHCTHDLQTAEIWYQMCWYLDKVIFQDEARKIMGVSDYVFAIVLASFVVIYMALMLIHIHMQRKEIEKLGNEIEELKRTKGG